MKLQFLKKLKIKNILIASFVALFIIIAAITIFLVQKNLQMVSISDAEERARLIMDRNMATHIYFTNILKPAVFNLIDKYIDKNYFDPVWMSSTHVNKEIHKLLIKQVNSDHPGYYYKECAINARNPENEADTHEAAFIAATNRDGALVTRSEIINYDGKPFLVFMRRGEVMDAACIRCHGKPEEAPGNMVKIYGDKNGFKKETGKVISAISIRVPLEEAYSKMAKFIKKLSGVIVLEFLGLFLLIYLIFKFMIINQLEIFKKKTDLIANDESQLGTLVSVPVGSEFNEMADSFNLMSSNLKHLKDTLESRIVERTIELEKLNKTKDKLFSIIGHDLKNPFHQIMGFSELIVNSKDMKTEDIKESCSLINQSAVNANNLLSNLLAWSQSQIAGPKFNPEIASLSDIIKKEVSEFYPLAAAKKIKIVQDTKDIKISLDVNMIKTVLRNLLTNAIKYSYPDGEIEIKAIEKDDLIEIMVKDHGTGMSEEYIEKLFKIGDNITREGTAHEKGTGLELLICREFIDKHGGQILIESSVGNGSIFILKLPKLSDHNKPQ